MVSDLFDRLQRQPAGLVVGEPDFGPVGALVEDAELDARAEADFGKRWDVELAHEEAYELYEKEFRNQVSTLVLGFDDRAGKSLSV